MLYLKGITDKTKHSLQRSSL